MRGRRWIVNPIAAANRLLPGRAVVEAEDGALHVIEGSADPRIEIVLAELHIQVRTFGARVALLTLNVDAAAGPGPTGIRIIEVDICIDRIRKRLTRLE